MTQSQTIPKPFFIGGSVLLIIALAWSYLHTLATPQETDLLAFQNAFKTIENQLKSNDVVLIHPPWRDDVVKDLKSHKKTPSSLAITTVLPENAKSIGRLVVLKDAEGPPLSRRVKNMHLIQAPTTTEHVEISFLKTVKTNRSDDHFDYMSLLPNAQVEVIKDNGKRTQCQWDASEQRFKCPGYPNWVYVGPHTMKSGKTTKKCIWSHPIRNGTIKIRFPNPPLKSFLVFEHALSQSAARSNNKSPVTAELVIDQQSLRTLTRTSRPGFSTSSLAIDKSVAQTLDLLIRTENDGARHYCFNLMTHHQGATP